jgi:hypothetical protein
MTLDVQVGCKMSKNAPFRQALKMIADSEGVTRSLLAKHGCDCDTLAVLIHAGFVIEVIERVTVTDAGKWALGGQASSFATGD